MSVLRRPRLSSPVGRAWPAGRERSTYSCAILGAGCAGLSLAWQIVRLGYREPILLLDRRTEYVDDRTWCFWDAEPTGFSDLATHRWGGWQLHDGRRPINVDCPRYPYLRLRSIDVYRRLLARLAAAPNVTIELGCPVLSREEAGGAVLVRTPDAEFRALHAFESRPPSIDWADPDDGETRLMQHFLGQTIRVDRSAFDPGRPVLMDFRTSQAHGPHFVYVLPLSDREALVENTYLFDAAIPADVHRAEIAAYLDECLGIAPGRCEVLSEEAGRIPMTTAPGPRATGLVVPIGLAGGAARPSSGYAFARIQRQALRLASWVATGGRTPAPHTNPSGRKEIFLDTVFLRTLADRPDLAPTIFGRLFADANSESVVRFLTDRGSSLDVLRVILALPKGPFVASSLRSARCWARRLAGR